MAYGLLQSTEPIKFKALHEPVFPKILREFLFY